MTTREAVAIDTPARRATCWRVGFGVGRWRAATCCDERSKSFQQFHCAVAVERVPGGAARPARTCPPARARRRRRRWRAAPTARARRRPRRGRCRARRSRSPPAPPSRGCVPRPGVDRCTIVSSATAEMEFRKPASASSAAADASQGAAPMAPSATAAEPAPQISDVQLPAARHDATRDERSDQRPAAQPDTMTRSRASRHRAGAPSAAPTTSIRPIPIRNSDHPIASERRNGDRADEPEARHDTAARCRRAARRTGRARSRSAPPRRRS